MIFDNSEIFAYSATSITVGLIFSYSNKIFRLLIEYRIEYAKDLRSISEIERAIKVEKGTTFMVDKLPIIGNVFLIIGCLLFIFQFFI